ncbi:TIGR04211 family SH3 domain-containing protein [Magnetococcales bacterium HHB-1]
MVTYITPLFLLIALLSWSPSTLHAADEYLYISDKCTVTMRRGENTSYRVLKMLKTGTRLKLIRRGKNGWDRVRTDAGVEGWVLKRFLDSEQPARLRFKSALEVRKKTEEERNELRHEISNLRSKLDSQKSLQAKFEKGIRASRDAVRLQEENQELKDRVKELRLDLDRIKDEKRVLDKQNTTEILIAGATILFIGLILGIILSRRKRRSVDGFQF